MSDPRIVFRGRGGVLSIKGVQGFVSLSKYKQGTTYSRDQEALISKAIDHAAKWIREDIVEVACSRAQDFLRGTVDAFQGIPRDTGNLHDSIGVAIFEDGNLVGESGFYAAEVAEKAQHWGAFPEWGIVAGSGYGADYALDIETPAFRHWKGSVAVVLAASIPYAGPIDEGTSKNPYYVGWFSIELAHDFYFEVLSPAIAGYGDMSMFQRGNASASLSMTGYETF